MKRYIFINMLCGLLCACSGHSDWSDCPRIVSEKGAASLTIEIEAIALDSVHTSLTGFSGVQNGEVYFFDKYFSYLYRFDSDGRFISREMGVGNGPKETIIRGASGGCFSAEGNFTITGNNADFQHFKYSDSSGEYRKMEYYDPFANSNFRADNFSIYSNAWDNLVHLSRHDKLYMTLNAEFPRFNYHYDTDKYLEDSFRLGVINLNDGKSDVMIKGFPQLYYDEPKKYSSVPYINIDLYETNGFIVNFEADSTIYFCDDKGVPILSFGRKGIDMDQEYIPVSSYESYKEYRKNRDEKGRYSALKFIPETGLIFRSYIKGKTSQYDGLQVYDKDGHFMADLEVPKDLKITGYIAPYYISQVYCDDTAMSQSIYRIKLK